MTEKEYNSLISRIEDKIQEDKYFKSTIYNLYLDTDNYDLIIKSIEKPLYKEKIRIRSYKIPNLEDKVFFEKKGKYKGVVFKRRIELTLKELYNYLETKELPIKNNQIMDELDYTVRTNSLKPKMFIAYDRLSYALKEDNNFRITFDYNLRSRTDELRLELGGSGVIFDDNYIMEIKSIGSIPNWFTDILSELKIYPKSFSKYGAIYKKEVAYV